MALYGYHISNLTRREKYEEIERFLDKKLKGWEKPNVVFEKDGTIRQRYLEPEGAAENEKADENETAGTTGDTEPSGRREVVLVKNVTESNITVYSDIEIKELKFDAVLLLLRDIPPMLVYIFFHWFIAAKFTGEGHFSASAGKLLVTQLICTLVFVIIDLLTTKLLSTRREMARIRIIQMGGPVPIIVFLYWMLVLVDEWQFKYALMGLTLTPAPACIASVIIATWISDRIK